MANPNKTVGNFRRKHGFNHSDATKAVMDKSREDRCNDPFFNWVVDQARAGRRFDNEQQAKEVYVREVNP